MTLRCLWFSIAVLLARALKEVGDWESTHRGGQTEANYVQADKDGTLQLTALGIFLSGSVQLRTTLLNSTSSTLTTT